MVFTRILGLGLAVLAGAAPLGAQSGGVSLAAIGHDKGGGAARIFVVEFADFGCSYCAKFAAETFGRLDTAYVSKGVVRWKMVPYVSGMFRNSREVTEAAECAGEQGRFWAMHDLLYARQREWKASKDIRPLIDQYVTRLQLDKAAFARCSMNPAIAQRIQRHNAVAAQLGVRATPTFFANGQMIQGALPYADFENVIAYLSR